MQSQAFRAHKTPTLYRSLFAVVILAAISRTAAAEPLTEADVIRLTRTRDPRVLVARETISVAQTDETRAALYPNPSVGWDREHTPGGAARERQDAFFVTVPIDFTGRRPAERALARAGAAGTRASAARTQSEMVTRSLDTFYAALAADQQVRLLAQSVSRIEEAARVIGRRHEEGTTSGYERTRLELELELARSELRQVEAQSRTARTALAVLLGVDPTTVELRGNFATVDPGAPVTVGGRPSIDFLKAAVAEAEDARSAAGSAWIPALSISGGFLMRETTETRYGYVAGLSLSIPLFSRGQEIEAESSARARLAAAEVHAAERETRVEELRAREQLVSARQEIARFTAAVRERLDILERAASSGYKEGQRSVVELIDAQKARTQIDRRRLEMELIAKRAEIDLRAARGDFE